jgi:hypothetical protein
MKEEVFPVFLSLIHTFNVILKFQIYIQQQLPTCKFNTVSTWVFYTFSRTYTLEETEGAITNGEFRDTGNSIKHKTQDEDKQNKENKKDDPHGPHQNPGMTVGVREG